MVVDAGDGLNLTAGTPSYELEITVGGSSLATALCIPVTAHAMGSGSLAEALEAVDTTALGAGSLLVTLDGTAGEDALLTYTVYFTGDSAAALGDVDTLTVTTSKMLNCTGSVPAAAYPSNVAVAPTAKSIPIQTVEVPWQPPADTGGTSVAHYLLEHWRPEEVVEEVQRVRVYNVLDGETSGSFGVGFRGDTALVPHNADAVTMRHSLMSIPSVGDVGVTRQAYNYGYQWDVTFRDHASNLGDQPRMVITSLPAAGNGTVYANVTQSVDGSRAGGRDEVQAVVTSSSGTGLNGVSGYFRLALSAAGPSTQLLPHDTTADVVRTALQQLPAVGRGAVSRDNPTSLGADGGATWRITFTGGTQPVGGTGHAWDAPVLVADGARLEGTAAAIAVQSADNDVGANGALNYPTTRSRARSPPGTRRWSCRRRS